jgi:hypothetical protein
LSFTSDPGTLRGNRKSHSTSYEERIMVKALRFHAHMPFAAIAQCLGLTQRQIQYATIAAPRPRYDQCGREPVVPPEVKQLIQDYVNTPNKSKRWLPWRELRTLIPALEPYGHRAIQAAMEAEGISRVLQPLRQPLSERARKLRLEFALKWAGLLSTDWESWIWSDETWVNGLGSGRKFVMVFPGEDPQEFAKVRMRANGWMFWACFAGNTKGSSLVWEKSWGKINSATYQEHILPLFKQFWVQNPGFKLQQDNAPAHSSKATKAFMSEHFPGADHVAWPPHSPDLNPIEHVWIFMKRWIERNYPQRPTGQALKAAIHAAWEAVPPEYLLKLVHSMPRRLESCIRAKGGYTGY